MGCGLCAGVLCYPTVRCLKLQGKLGRGVGGTKKGGKTLEESHGVYGLVILNPCQGKLGREH